MRVHGGHADIKDRSAPSSVVQRVKVTVQLQTMEQKLNSALQL